MTSQRLRRPLILADGVAAASAQADAHAQSTPAVKTKGQARIEPTSSPRIRTRAWPAVAAGVIAAALWVGAIVAMVAATRPPGPWRDLEIVQTGGLAAIPAAFILLLAYALAQGLNLAREARSARGLSDDLVAPVALAAAHTGGVVETLRAEIAHAAAAAADATRQLEGVRETLSAQSRQVFEAAREAERSAQAIGDALTAQRLEISRLAADLGAQAQAEGVALAERSRLVHEASVNARETLQAADSALADRTGALAAAVAGAQAVVDSATGDLDAQARRLNETAATLDDTLTRFGVGVADERARLAELVEALQLEQEEAAALAESRGARLVAQVAEAHAAAADVDAAASRGADAYRTLAAEASARHDALVASTQSALGEVAAAAAAAGERLSALHDDAGASAAEARSRIDELGEAAFEAGRRADQAFAARCAEAQRSVETVSSAMEEAARLAAERVEKGVESTRELLQGVEAMLRDVDARYARLPVEAKQRTEDARKIIENGVQSLTAAARRAVEDPQAVDAAFQERVRRDYARLTEAVRLMGVTPDPAPAPAPAPAPRVEPPPSPVAAPIAAPAPAPLRREPKPEPEPAFVEVDLQRAAAGRARRFGATGEAASAQAPVDDAAVLRPRLRLTPTRADEAIHALFAPQPSAQEPAPSTPPRSGPGGPTREAATGWTWKDLLSTVNEASENDEDDAAEHLASEIANLGLDAAALLPHARIAEVTRALHAAGADGARDAVRRIAPAAVRRLSRRVLTDRLLRAEASRFVREQGDAVDAALRAGDPAVMALYASEVGRTHLLLDAAVGDLD